MSGLVINDESSIKSITNIHSLITINGLDSASAKNCRLSYTQ